MRALMMILALLPALCLAQGQTVDWNTVKTSTFSTTAISQALSRASLVDWTNANSFTALSVTRGAGGVVTAMTLRWPDGSTGTFTTTTVSTACPGAVDAFTATYVPASGSTETVTQSAVTRSASCAVTAQPAPTLSP